MQVISSQSVTASWTELDCAELNGPAVGYIYEVTLVGSGGNPVKSGTVSATRLFLQQLVPFTEYEFSVAFANTRFNGSKTTATFTTNEDGKMLLLCVVLKVVVCIYIIFYN